MKLIHQYPTQTEKHVHEPIEKFMGRNQEIFYPVYGLTHQDPNNPTCIYFNAGFILEAKNSSYEQVFLLKTRTTFMIDNSNHRPTVNFLLPLTNIAFEEFCKIFSKKINNTNLHNHKVPVFDNIEQTKNLQNCIEIWDRSISNISIN